MRRRWAIVVMAAATQAAAQYGEARFAIPATISGAGTASHIAGEAPRDGSPLTGGFRTVFYPTWKLSDHWYASGAMQVHSRPYFYSQLATPGYGVKGDLLQGYLGYSRNWGEDSLRLKVGQISSAFGAFPLRYDDMWNPLIDIPKSYGYYYEPVTVNGLAGAQVDATVRRFDLRAQFTNSAPNNRRSLFDRDQYGAWTGGAGYTILQGVRIGASAYRGPYLHREHRFFFPGEIRPRDLPSTGLGLDAQVAVGHWNFSGELIRARNAYTAIPDYTRTSGYLEAKYAFHPRWYAAARFHAMRSSAQQEQEVYDLAVGYRPNRLQLLKVGYQIVREPGFPGAEANVFGFQLVTRVDDLLAPLR